MEIDVPDGFVAGDAPAGIVVRPRTEADGRDIVATWPMRSTIPRTTRKYKRASRYSFASKPI